MDRDAPIVVYDATPLHPGYPRAVRPDRDRPRRIAGRMLQSLSGGLRRGGRGRASEPYAKLSFAGSISRHFGAPKSPRFCVEAPRPDAEAVSAYLSNTA